MVSLTLYQFFFWVVHRKNQCLKRIIFVVTKQSSPIFKYALIQKLKHNPCLLFRLNVVVVITFQFGKKMKKSWA